MPRLCTFSTIDEATPLLFSHPPGPFLSLSSAFVLSSLGSSHPFLVASKLDATKFTVLPHGHFPRPPPFSPPVSDRGRLVVQNLERAHSRRYCFTLCELSRAPPPGVTYEKRRNPPPARKTFIKSLRNELERRLRVLRRTCVCIRGAPKEFPGSNSWDRCTAESEDENVLRETVISRRVSEQLI